MSKILITGASGFLGLATVNELANAGQHEIYAVTTGRRDVAFPKDVRPVRADLLDRAQAQSVISEIQPSVMLHLAWELSNPSYVNADSNMRWLEQSLFVLRAFAEAGGQQFAFAGSSAEYAKFGGFSEGEHKNAVSLYGQCKRSFNDVAVKFCAQEGLRYTNIRYFPILGRGMRANTSAAAAVASTLLHNEIFECRSPYNIWDFIDIDDAAKATRAVLESGYDGTVNVGSGTPRLMGDVFKEIARKMDREHLLRLDYANTSSEVLLADTSLLNKHIGYRCKKDFGETLDDLIAAVREREKPDAD